jgi:hypothetical protein
MREGAQGLSECTQGRPSFSVQKAPSDTQRNRRMLAIWCLNGGFLVDTKHGCVLGQSQPIQL